MTITITQEHSDDISDKPPEVQAARDLLDRISKALLERGLALGASGVAIVLIKEVGGGYETSGHLDGTIALEGHMQFMDGLRVLNNRIAGAIRQAAAEFQKKGGGG